MIVAIFTLVGVLVGVTMGGTAGWYAALSAASNKIDAALATKREATKLIESARQGETQAIESYQRLHDVTVQEAVELKLISPPPAKQTKGGRCGCGHAKSFHRAEGPMPCTWIDQQTAGQKSYGIEPRPCPCKQYAPSS